MSRNHDQAQRMRRHHAVAALVAFSIGAGAHFLFDAIGRWPPLGWIAPVNESLWEHIKMAFWPTLAVDAALGARLPTLAHRVVCASASASIGALLIVPLFYGYTGIVGRHYLVADVGIFAVAILAGHWVSYRIAIAPVPSTSAVVAALGLAVCLGGALVAFTYLPPHMELFRDSLTGGFGIEGHLGGPR